MTADKKDKRLLPVLIIYLALPAAYMIFGNYPERSLLKELISFLTVAAFFLMFAQFFLARSNKKITQNRKMSRVVKVHKILGYAFIPILLVHPFLIVVPRFFEAGVDPMEAFKTIITQYESGGIIIGIIAWVLMLILGLTSMFRKHLPMKYTTWRTFHGSLSIVFIILATWHAVGLGRHTDLIMSSYMIVLAAVGVFLLLRLYLLNPKKGGAK